MVHPKVEEEASGVGIDLERNFSMQGGKGDTSYFRNSDLQASHLRALRPLLEDTIENMSIFNLKHLCIADLGCSYGLNTLFTAATIVQKLRNKYTSTFMTAPEFQVLFSDLPSNDFNTLFRLLPQLESPNKVSDDQTTPSIKEERSYFAAAVPGSFYKRLFPAKSLHFVHSSFSLHWLSQVPSSVQDVKSPAWNQGRVFISKGHPLVAEAYRQQFKNDFHSFLVARAMEIVGGGRMFLVCLGRSESEPSEQSGAGILFGTHFEDAWDYLISEGLVEKAKRDTFNIPVFAPSIKEVEEVVEQESSFTIEKLDIVKAISPISQREKDQFKEKGGFGKFFVNSCRSICESLVQSQLGNNLTSILFQQMEHAAEANADNLMEDIAFEDLIVVLQRKN